ncbi:hypothetical protein D0Z67_29565 (plasmid) [Streptomyces seoulensis]|uniref:Uncharacterized protein n=1 Tax=Streptomyces seoulensis TaxID=73044 RepID=A0A4P6U862_STRSO|nr:hypothetical protein D0Z67_29565 [Streptomyces seoulensis]
MAISGTPHRVRHDTTPVIAAVLSLVMVLAAVLMWQNSRAQDRLTTLRSGQTAGLAQRTDQQQLTCALWAILRNDRAADITAQMRQAADRICSEVPTPTPSAS